MHEKLNQVRLKSGERLEILLVEAPDEEYRDEVLKLLGHKGKLRKWQLEQDFEGLAAGLHSRFYLGLIEDEPVANISVWESHSVGDLGHVYTAEAHRRKGICRALMDSLMEDFRRRGGRFMVLGTGYGSPPYYIYSRFGFESMQPGSGSMEYRPDDLFFSEFFAPGQVECGALEWRDLGPICALMALPEGDWLRSKTARKFGPTCYEAPLVREMRESGEGRIQARVARTSSGAVAGYGVLCPDAEWEGQSWVLNLFVHPGFSGAIGELLAGFEWPEARIHCYLDADSPTREGLKGAGFVEEARLVALLRRGDEAIEVSISRRGE